MGLVQLGVVQMRVVQMFTFTFTFLKALTFNFSIITSFPNFTDVFRYSLNSFFFLVQNQLYVIKKTEGVVGRGLGRHELGMDPNW